MFSYDVSTDIGKVRMLIPDRDGTTPTFQDEEVSAFLALEGSNVYRGAALALETVASDTAATLRVTTTLGLSVDGAKASDALLKRAAELRTQADDADARDGGLFDYAEWAVDAFSARERIHAEWLRSGV